MIPDPKTETTEGADQRISELRRRLSIGVRSFDRDDVVYLLDALSRPQATPDPRIAEIRQMLVRHDAADATLKSVQELASKCPDYYAIVTDAVMAERAIEDNAVQIVRDMLDSLSALKQRVEQVTAERDDLDGRLRVASSFVRGVIDALGFEQPPLDATISLNDLTLQVIGHIEEGKTITQGKEAAEATIGSLTSALNETVEWLRGWPTTTCRSNTGVDVPIVMMNPENLEAQADKLLAFLPSSPVSRPVNTGRLDTFTGIV